MNIAVTAITCLGLFCPSQNTPVTPAHQGCLNPSIASTSQGLMFLKCFPNIPVDVYPVKKGDKCEHEDAVVTNIWNVKLNGHIYKVSDKLRQDIEICR